MLLAPETFFSQGDGRLPAEEPPGKLVVGAAPLAAEIPLDLGPEVQGRYAVSMITQISPPPII